MNELTDKIWGDIEARLVDIKRALADQTEQTHRYVFGVAKSRIESLRGRFPKFTAQGLFEQVLNEDKAEISEHVLEGLRMPYKIEFRGARCRLPRARPEADYTTRRGIRIWSEKPSFPMDLRFGEERKRRSPGYTFIQRLSLGLSSPRESTAATAPMARRESGLRQAAGEVPARFRNEYAQAWDEFEAEPGPSGATKPGEDLVDADFEVVNDDKKKS
jgi:hypothetical protein